MSMSNPTDKLDTPPSSPWPVDDSRIDMLYGIDIAEDINRKRATDRVEDSTSDVELAQFQDTQDNGVREWQGGQDIMYIRPKARRIEEGVGWDSRGEPSYPVAIHLSESRRLRGEHHARTFKGGLRAG